MFNSDSSSKTPISQEVENPSSFNFSFPTLEESPSTPFCGVGEMDESITPTAKVIAFLIHLCETILACSPILVLSGEKSQNLEAHYVAKPSVEPLSKETEVGSMAISSTMSETLFKGDLPKGKGLESCILAAGAELVAIQSLASLRGYIQPTLLEHELRSLHQVPHRSSLVFDQTPKSFTVESDEEEVSLKWSSKGMRGANYPQMVPDLEIVKGTSEDDTIAKLAERSKERKRKGKGKLVETHSKREVKKYGTRSVTQKFMGSAIASNDIQTKRIRKMRQEGLLPEEPTSTLVAIENSETESEDISKYMAK
ncbi:hypothetical protein H5410_056169 [Solanum commersonii]|uniref:Uncharacterized protein n=1 Tax=Solanum commersonii TaxID=4109 RepID=A0A9J5WJI4_SOLCO|nr:hypothetical protein H5410_056169 [Solanum commersonii]